MSSLNQTDDTVWKQLIVVYDCWRHPDLPSSLSPALLTVERSKKATIIEALQHSDDSPYRAPTKADEVIKSPLAVCDSCMCGCIFRLIIATSSMLKHKTDATVHLVYGLNMYSRTPSIGLFEQNGPYKYVSTVDLSRPLHP